MKYLFIFLLLAITASQAHSEVLTQDQQDVNFNFRFIVNTGNIEDIKTFVERYWHDAPIPRAVLEETMRIEDAQKAKEVLAYLLQKDNNRTDLNNYDQKSQIVILGKWQGDVFMEDFLNTSFLIHAIDLSTSSSHNADTAREIAKFLIKHPSVDVNAKGVFGYTALHWASERGDEELCKLLVLAGANVNEKNYGCFTPLDLAYKERHYRLVFALRALGAKCGCLKWSPKKQRDCEVCRNKNKGFFS